MMQGASELQKALELPDGVPPGMGREISPLGEQPTATKIKDEIKHLDHKLLEDAIDHGPKAYSDAPICQVTPVTAATRSPSTEEPAGATLEVSTR